MRQDIKELRRQMWELKRNYRRQIKSLNLHLALARAQLDLVLMIGHKPEVRNGNGRGAVVGGSQNGSSLPMPDEQLPHPVHTLRENGLS